MEYTVINVHYVCTNKLPQIRLRTNLTNENKELILIPVYIIFLVSLFIAIDAT